MKLKLCGIRTSEMLRACHGGKVDFVGFNFVPDSKRRVLRMPDFSSAHPYKRVGIFRDQSLDYIFISTKQHYLDVIQLHGDESPAFVDQLLQRFEELKYPPTIWKAVSVENEALISKLPEYCKNCELILFDGKNPGSGTRILDQEKLQAATMLVKKTGTKVGLAGGINADNISEIRNSAPEFFLLDTASGLERNGGFSLEETQRLINAFHA